MKEKFCGYRRGPGAAAARENWKVGTKQARVETNMGGEADPLALRKGGLWSGGGHKVVKGKLVGRGA